MSVFFKIVSVVILVAFISTPYILLNTVETQNHKIGQTVYARCLDQNEMRSESNVTNNIIRQFLLQAATNRESDGTIAGVKAGAEYRKIAATIKTHRIIACEKP